MGLIILTRWKVAGFAGNLIFEPPRGLDRAYGVNYFDSLESCWICWKFDI